MSLEKGWSLLVLYDFVLCCNFSLIIYYVLFALPGDYLLNVLLGFKKHTDKFISIKKELQIWGLC